MDAFTSHEYTNKRNTNEPCVQPVGTQQWQHGSPAGAFASVPPFLLECVWGRVFPGGFQMVTLIRVGKTVIGNGICFVWMFAGDWTKCLAPAR